MKCVRRGHRAIDSEGHGVTAGGCGPGEPSPLPPSPSIASLNNPDSPEGVTEPAHGARGGAGSRRGWWGGWQLRGGRSRPSPSHCLAHASSQGGGSGCRRHRCPHRAPSKAPGAALRCPCLSGSPSLGFPYPSNEGCRSHPRPGGKGLRDHRGVPTGGHRLHSLQRGPPEQLLPALHQPLPAQRVPAGPGGRGRGLPGLRQVRPPAPAPALAPVPAWARGWASPTCPPIRAATPGQACTGHGWGQPGGWLHVVGPGGAGQRPCVHVGLAFTTGSHSPFTQTPGRGLRPLHRAAN